MGGRPQVEADQRRHRPRDAFWAPNATKRAAPDQGTRHLIQRRRPPALWRSPRGSRVLSSDRAVWMGLGEPQIWLECLEARSSNPWRPRCALLPIPNTPPVRGRARWARAEAKPKYLASACENSEYLTRVEPVLISVESVAETCRRVGFDRVEGLAVRSGVFRRKHASACRRRRRNWVTRRPRPRRALQRAGPWPWPSWCRCSPSGSLERP